MFGGKNIVLLQTKNVQASTKVSLVQFFDYCVENNLPLAIYHLPESGIIKVIAQKKSSLQKIVPGTDYIYRQGFLFAPFHEDEHASKIIIAPDIFTTEDALPELNFATQAISVHTDEAAKPKLKETGKEQFKAYVKKIKEQIHQGIFDKVVAARVERKKKPDDFNPVAFFTELRKKYPLAFTSLVYTKQYGLWIGASPEVLLNVDGNGFKTYALAGTKANTNWNAKTEWSEKDKNEQRIVSDYIAKAFETVSKQAPVITGPETIYAGNVLHLSTSFVYSSIPYYNWQKIVEQLHPTPAVAGLPKPQAIAFILKNENAPRAFYSGYLGPVNMDEQINLFVNIRCMQVLKGKLAVYVGCGIMEDSKPGKEWKESKIKAQTLLSVLNPAKQQLKVTRNISPLPPDEHDKKGGTADNGDLQAQGNP